MNQGPTLIGGRYELGELLGRGGMAEVRKGTDTRLGRVVAVKRLRTDLASDATFQARFRREAQSSASLNHPSIVSVYDTGEELATDGSGIAQPYIVMEYVAGRTLRDILREGRKILPERALEISSGVLSALDYSHRAGIIHRDIKPGNVMLTPSGDVKVMDFGIARAISDASSAMTQTAAVVGTAQYLSPEQARGETVDSRSDVYSAGCLVYELLTGRPPFVGDSPVAVAYQHVREPAVPPSDHDTSLTPEIDAIVMKALAKRVEDRYQSAAAMRADIERYLAGHPVRATAPPLPPEPQTTVAPTYANDPATQSTITTQAVPPDDDGDGGSRTGLIVLLGALLVALIVGAAFLLPSLFEDSPEQVQVPDLIGMTEAQARAAIGDAGLSVGQPEYVADADVARDKVVKQDPNRDTFVDPGATVTITVSTGKPMTSVPAVVGQDRATARATMESANLVADLRREGVRRAQGPGHRDRPGGRRAGAGGHQDHRLLLRRPREGAGRRGHDRERGRAGAQAGRLQGVRHHVERHRGAQGHGDQPEPRGRQRAAGGDLGDDRGLVVRGADRDPHADAERHPDGAADRHAHRDPQRRPPDTLTHSARCEAQPSVSSGWA